MGGKREARPVWRAPFLRALMRTGNVTLAARAAGTWRGRVYAVRRKDAGFAEQWEGALEEAQKDLESGAEGFGPEVGQGADITDPARKGAAGDGRVVRRNKNRRVQIAAARASDWTSERELVFLAELAATCNVAASARAAGFTSKCAYARRRQWPGFAEAWDAMLALGYPRLEAKLLRQATNGIVPPDGERLTARIAEEDEDAAIVDVALALSLLKLRQAAMRALRAQGRGAGEAAAPDEPSIEAMRDELLGRLAAIRAEKNESPSKEEPIKVVL